MILDNRYEVLSVVKSGAMGCVYKALDTHLDNIVALKQMISTFSKPQDIVYAEQRFKEEAKLLAKLHHGGLPKVIDHFIVIDPVSHKTAHYLVMSFIEGKDLETIISERKKKPFPVEQALDYFKQMLEILQYLHTQNPPVIYRDLKPSNIMLQNNKIFLVDFGIARIFSPQQQGTAIGTSGYAAPEQYRGSAEPRSDIYSLGVVMHYLLTGKNPQESMLPLFTFEPPGKINPQIPEYLDKLITSMIDLVPTTRPESAVKISEILKTGSRRPTSQSVSITTASMPAVPTVVKTVPKSTTIRGDKQKYNSIIEAINHRDIEAVKVFIKTGSYINGKTADGNSILHRAVTLGEKDIAELLISNGADVNSRGKDGLMPLHFACSEGNKEIMQLLLAKGADLYARSISGETPLDKAEEGNHIEIVAMLQKWTVK